MAHIIDLAERRFDQLPSPLVLKGLFDSPSYE
jgi:hypothetical protein